MFSHVFLQARNGFRSSGIDASGDGGGGFSRFSNFGNQRNDNNASVYQAQSATSNSTDGLSNFNPLAVIRAAQFSAAKSIRTSTIILAVFNTIAAFATFAWIIYYSRQNHRQLPYSQRMRKGFLSFVSSPDLFPLIVSGSITIQGIIFAVAQSRGLDGFNGSGCTLISQFMLPGLLLVPTTQFVLGCELLLRGLKAKPFQERGRWMVPICLAVIGLITLISFLVADFARVDDKCFMSLFWFVSDYSVGIFVILAVFGTTLFGIAIFLFMKLSRTSGVEPTERVNASRMIYFLALAVLSNAFMCPFFFVMGFMRTKWGEGPANALNLSMIAAVVASVSGLMTGGLHLFLRSSSISTIGPKDKWEENERLSLKKKIRLRGFNSINDYAMESVGGNGYGGSDNGASFGAYSKAEEARMGITSPAFAIDTPNTLRSNAVVYPQVATAVQVPLPVQIGKSHLRKTSNYSLFPAKDAKASVTLLPSTTYNPNVSNNSAGNLLTVPNCGRSMPKPPPSVRSNNVGRHRRDSSIASLATVQIGLRLSNVENIPDINPKFLNEDDGRVHHLDCPLAIKAAREGEEARRPSPLSMTPGYESDEDTVCARESDVPEDLPQRDPVKDIRMKTLPPVPMPDQTPQSEEEQEITLSPKVYTPQSPVAKAKLPSPRGVGFTTPPKRTNTNTSSQPSTPTDQGSGGGTKRSQWI